MAKVMKDILALPTIVAFEVGPFTSPGASSAKSVKTVDFSFIRPMGVSKDQIPTIFIQPISNDVLKDNFATRIANVDAKDGKVHVTVHITKIRPAKGWSFNLNLSVLAVYPVVR